ncbi:hypothetical protein [Hansschlegelia plantiphila]|uniref:hypothetical protein n=1 Tax=Hansschlegelia plantiphila TaxID=374655 RepID=UPI0022F25BE1|nr:hypothetical protein [Hansschlegelia plantiphila]
MRAAFRMERRGRSAFIGAVADMDSGIPLRCSRNDGDVLAPRSSRVVLERLLGGFTAVIPAEVPESRRAAFPAVDCDRRSAPVGAVADMDSGIPLRCSRNDDVGVQQSES